MIRSFNSMALKYGEQGLFILDQTLLPHQESWLLSPDVDTMISFIQQLKVRGAPLIAVAAALQLALFAEATDDESEILGALERLREARPTAVNLMNAMDLAMLALKCEGRKALIAVCENVAIDDVTLCDRIAQNGAPLIAAGETILTHCNTGGLATAGVGTALGVIAEAHRAGKRIHVYVDETRPLLQGARLTAWELARLEIPHTLICDNMAASLMAQGKIDRVLVGADRIAVNGDFANKVGTYGVAVLCQYHQVPFAVVAPVTTVDRHCPNGAAIPIEERARTEVLGYGLAQWGNSTSAVWNPAFDVTPAKLVSHWILDTGVYSQADIDSGILS